MGMRITADGGGSKLLMLMFDGDYRLTGKGKSGPVNQLYTKKEAISENVRTCTKMCAGEAGEVEVLYDSIVGVRENFVNDVSSVLKVGEFKQVFEHGMQLTAGLGSRTGFLALSGTGSGVSYVKEGIPQLGCGGWGYELGDQGSGADLGMTVLREIIKAESGWAPATVMRDMLMEEWKMSHPRDIVARYHFNEDPRALAASLSRICSRAALAGDAVAADIFRRMGEAMGEQFIGLLKRYNYNGDRLFRFVDWEGNKREVTLEGEKRVCVNGGTWRGSTLMFDAFRSHLAANAPEFEAVLPIFSPIVGGVITDACERYGQVSPELMSFLKSEYRDYTFAFDRA